MNKDFPDDQIVLNFQSQRVFSALGRNIMILLEDLRKFHTINFDKLHANLPPEMGPIIDMADYFDENAFAHYRGRVLGLVNTAKRDLEMTINNK